MANSLISLNTSLPARTAVASGAKGEVLPSRQIGLLVAAVGLISLCHQGKAVLTSVGGYLTMLAAQRLTLGMRLRLLRQSELEWTNWKLVFLRFRLGAFTDGFAGF